MNNILFALLMSATLFQAGCASTGQHITDSQEFWFNDQSDHSPTLYYCKANKKPDGDLLPACYKAEMKKYRVQD